MYWYILNWYKIAGLRVIYVSLMQAIVYYYVFLFCTKVLSKQDECQILIAAPCLGDLIVINPTISSTATNLLFLRLSHQSARFQLALLAGVARRLNRASHVWIFFPLHVCFFSCNLFLFQVNVWWTGTQVVVLILVYLSSEVSPILLFLLSNRVAPRLCWAACSYLLCCRDNLLWWLRWVLSLSG